jgi:predicted small secreted protein
MHLALKVSMTKQLDTILSSVLILAFGLLLAFVMSSCQTTKGFGRDMEDAGKSIQKEASK